MTPRHRLTRQAVAALPVGAGEARAGEPRPSLFCECGNGCVMPHLHQDASEAAAPSLDVERLAGLVKRYGLSQMLNESGPAFLPLRDLLSDALRQHAALIVYAVNRLPDYEAAVDALAMLLADLDREDIGGMDPGLWESHGVARAALARLEQDHP